jgi:hypothetical protein
MPLARLWWLLDRNCDLVHTEITENTEKMNDEPLRLGRLVLRYACALSKILGFLWLRIIKISSIYF